MRLKKVLNNIKYHINKWFFLRAFNSPFKRPKVKFYFGEIKISTPYFLPRKWVKFTKQDCIDKAKEDYAKGRDHIEFDKLVESYKNYSKPVPMKFGFNFCGLGYKYKWEEIRYEWSPILSFVCFGKQFCLLFLAPDKKCDSQYWESWLYYYLHTNKKETVENRLKQCFNEAPCTWSRTGDDGEKVVTNYYEHILKDKYLKLIVCKEK